MRKRHIITTFISVILSLSFCLPTMAEAITSDLPKVPFTEKEKDKVVATDQLYFISGKTYYGLYTINGEYYISLDQLYFIKRDMSTTQYIPTTFNIRKNEVIVGLPVQNAVGYWLGQKGKEIEGRGDFAGINYVISPGMSPDDPYAKPVQNIVQYTRSMPQGKIMGDASVSDILVLYTKTPYTYEKNVTYFKTYYINGDFALISLKDLSTVIPVTYMADTRSFQIGTIGIQKAPIYEKDLLGEVLNKIVTNQMTDREKVVAIYHYIIDNMRYVNPSGLDGDPKTTLFLDKKEAATQKGYVDQYNLLLDMKIGKCEDYSALFKSFCDRLGIPCTTIFSGAMLHEWNKVFVDGQWLFVDVTWAQTSKTKNAYLLKDKATMKKTHRIFDPDYDGGGFDNYIWR